MTDDERIGIIRDLTAQGLSCAKIAPFAECSVSMVSVIRKRCGMKLPEPAVRGRPTRAALLACGDMPIAEMCLKFKRGNGVIKMWMADYEIVRPHGGRNKSHLVDLREIKDLAGAGMCATHIAKETGHSAFKVVRIARSNNIELLGGDPNAASRKRPDRTEFSKAYKRYELADLAQGYGVTMETVAKWELHYGLRAVAPVLRPRLMHKDECTRPIAGSFSAGAIERALVKAGAR